MTGSFAQPMRTESGFFFSSGITELPDQDVELQSEAVVSNSKYGALTQVSRFRPNLAQRIRHLWNLLILRRLS